MDGNDCRELLTTARRLLGIADRGNRPARPGDDELLAAGVGPGTVRLSVGTESVEDLIWDLEQAFKGVAA